MDIFNFMLSSRTSSSYLDLLVRTQRMHDVAVVSYSQLLQVLHHNMVQWDWRSWRVWRTDYGADEERMKYHWNLRVYCFFHR